MFTIFVESRESGSDTIRRSKLHLVDLAGSERVHKTNSSGSILREAQHINQSLHYLEMVILALHEKKTKGRTHIPYRNSMMTSVLRDSLGGNCKTVMVATINAEAVHTDESISTCRFAQRVALIQNEAKLNEAVDPTLVVKRLKTEIKQLREEVAYLREQLGEGGGKNANGEALEDHEIRGLRELVQAYVDQYRGEPDVPLSLGGNPSFLRIHAAYKLLREIALRSGGGGSGSGGGEKMQHGAGGADPAEMERLQELLAHRDNEISILVNMVKRGKSVPPTNFEDASATRASSSAETSTIRGGGPPLDMAPTTGHSERPPHPNSARGSRTSSSTAGGMPPPVVLSADILKDKRRSFDVFRKSYPHHQAIEENKALLRTRYNSAKKMGKLVNDARTSINSLKARIEQVRVERAMVEGSGGKSAGEDGAAEEGLQQQMQSHKSSYKENFSHLRDLKAEVERIQSRLQKQRVRMQKEFETWYGTMLRNSAADAARQPEPRQTNFRNQRQEVQHSTPPLRAAEAWHRPLPAPEPHPGADAAPGGEGGGGAVASAQFLTGDENVDQDILAFFKAKEELMRRSKGGR